MAQMKRLMGVSEAIARCSEALAELATALREMYSAADPEPDNPSTAQVDTPAESKTAITIVPITIAQVRDALAAKVCEGHKDAVKALLTKHGADKLSDVPATEYEELLAEAEAIHG